MEENNLKNDIDFIKKIMNDSRVIIVEDGSNFIFWGILVFIGLVSTFFDVKIGGSHINGYIWLFLVAVGWAYSIRKYFILKPKRKVSSLAGKMLGGIWASTGIAATIIGFIGPMLGAYHSVMISPLIAIILGCAYLTSGIIYGLKWISALSAGWWGGAVLIFFFPNLYSLLIMAGMMLFFQIIPGIILYGKSKKQLVQEV